MRDACLARFEEIIIQTEGEIDGSISSWGANRPPAGRPKIK